MNRPFNSHVVKRRDVNKVSISIILFLLIFFIISTGASASTTPSGDNYNTYTIENQNSPWTYGDWTYSLLDVSGNNDPNGFVDILDGGFDGNCLHITGVLNTDVSVQIKPKSGLGNFHLDSFKIQKGNNDSFKVLGYKNGMPVATKNITAPAHPNWLTVSLTGSEWQDIDEFRIEDQDLDSNSATNDVAFYMDDLTVNAPVTTPQNSTVSPTTATFDKYDEAVGYADVTTTITLNGNTLSAVKLGATTLTESTQYTVSGNVVTLKKDYLATLGTGAQEFTIDMSAGTDPTLTVTISDSTPVPASGLTVTSSDVTGAANNGKTNIGFEEDLVTGQEALYKNFEASTVTVPNVGDTLTGYTLLPVGGDISAAAGDNIAVAVVDTNDEVVKFGQTTAVVVTEHAVAYAEGAHGSISSSGEDVADGDSPTQVPTVTPDAGYTFAGWSTDGGTTLLSTSSVEASTVTANITYTAYYSMIADEANNSISSNSTTVTKGVAITLTAAGHRQSSIGAVVGDEQFIPVSWVSTETDQSGVFTINEGAYTSTYTPSETGTYTVTATFQKKVWDGDSWEDAVGETDTKTVSITVEDLSISVSPVEGITFPTQLYMEYDNDTVYESITISKPNGTTIPNVTATLGGGDESKFTIGTVNKDIFMNATSNSATLLVRPKNMLPVGTYTETLTISGDGAISDSIDLSFTVDPQPAGSISLDPSDSYDFDSAGTYYEGYSSIPKLPLSLQKVGHTYSDVPNVQVSFDKGNATPFTMGTVRSDTLKPGVASATAQVGVKSNLPAGVYVDTLTITADGGVSDSIDLSITIHEVHTVEFRTGASEVYETQHINDEGYATLPAEPTQTGYTFGGWFTDSGMTEPFDHEDPITQDRIIYAKWNINSYTVHFHSNGGTVIADETVNYGDKVTAPAEPVRAGYSFDGWYTTDTFTEAYNFNSAVTGSMDLYAKWELLKAATPNADVADGMTVTNNSTVTLSSTTVGSTIYYTSDGSTPTTASSSGTNVTVTGTSGDTVTIKAMAVKDGMANSEVAAFTYTIAHVYSIETIDDQTMQTLIQGYESQDAETIQITNTGSDHLTNLTVTASGVHAGVFDISQPLDTVLTSGASTAFTINAQHGLPAGTYTATVTISADNMTDMSFTVTQVVNLPDAPVNPQNLVATSGDRQINLGWDTVTGATYYHLYMSTTSGQFDDIPITTVTEATYQVQGLSNGTMYYFVVKAGNDGGLSGNSNQASATPATVPLAPSNVTAVSGNGSATIHFTAPTYDGGSAITGFEVTASPGNIVVTGDASPIRITGLSNGTTYTFTVKSINSQGTSDESTPSNEVIPIAPSRNDDGDDDDDDETEPAVPELTGVNVLVNGKVESAGTATIEVVNGQEVITVVVGEEKLQQRLDEEGDGAIITIPVTTGSDVVIGELNGRMVKNMENQQAVVEILTETARYTLPAAQMNIDAISEGFGAKLALQDIRVKIIIAVPQTETVRIVEDAANREGLTLIVPPLNFEVSAVYGERTEEVTRFNAYVERRVAIPEGIDPNQITTGVVVEPDGTVRHVPTKVAEIEGVYFAVINSLTNSTYSVVWHPTEFKDMANHWANEAVNNMGARMVVEGTGNEMFSPDRDITRAEFSAIAVRGLGLKLENGESLFTDVKPTDWFSSAVQTAYQYGLIHGYEDGTFRPDERITREEAMHIMANAMMITGLNEQLEDQPAESVLQSYHDADDIDSWAISSIAKSVKAGLVSGRSNDKLAPKGSITRAEVATLLERLLKKSELI